MAHQITLQVIDDSDSPLDENRIVKISHIITVKLFRNIEDIETEVFSYIYWVVKNLMYYSYGLKRKPADPNPTSNTFTIMSTFRRPGSDIASYNSEIERRVALMANSFMRSEHVEEIESITFKYNMSNYN